MFEECSVVMEYADGGDLLQKIVHYRNKGQYFEEGYIWDIFGQIVNGLAKLHELGILHRDIKVLIMTIKDSKCFPHEKWGGQNWRYECVEGGEEKRNVRDTNWHSLLRKPRSVEG